MILRILPPTWGNADEEAEDWKKIIYISVSPVTFSICVLFILFTMNEEQRARVQLRQRLLMDAIMSMDKGDSVEEEWRPDEDCVQALFMAEVERIRAERLTMNSVSRGVSIGRRLRSIMRQPMPTLSSNLLMSINIPEYEQKEE